MILLDTNVASELLRQTPARPVAAWLDRIDIERLCLSSISWLELQFGVELLSDGGRKTKLAADIEDLRRLFGGRILPFDVRAAEETARLYAARRKSGRNVDWRDTQIAGVSLANNATLATRNTKHFDDVTIKSVNPWTDQP